jgi:hypothetical protein
VPRELDNEWSLLFVAGKTARGAVTDTFSNYRSQELLPIR